MLMLKCDGKAEAELEDNMRSLVLFIDLKLLSYVMIEIEGDMERLGIVAELCL